MQTPSDGMSGPVDPAPRPTRRTFTAEYKARIVAEYEAAPHGEKSAVSAAGGPVPLPRPGVGGDPRRRRAGRPGPSRCTSDRRQRQAEQAEIDRLRAENQRLTGKLAQTQAALSIMGKAHELLESLAESAEPPTRVEQVMDETFTALTARGLPVTAACRLVGRARASHYRHVRPPVHGPQARGGHRDRRR